MATDIAIETKYLREKQLAWVDGPPSMQRRAYEPPVSFVNNPGNEKKEPFISGAKICKVTDERTHGIFGWFPTSYDYDDLCTDVMPKREDEDVGEWFLRQENSLRSFLAGKAAATARKRETRIHSGPPCFPGSAYLLKEDGSTITFNELAELSNSGLEIPAIASWSEGGRTVYQKPTAVIDRGIVNSELLFIGASDGIGSVAPLQVTGNHPLLVERDGVKDWVPAGELADGDVLVGLGGEKYNFDRSATLGVMGGVHLYDVSFTTPEGSFSPTFMVSSDGKTWYVAHNKMM